MRKIASDRNYRIIKESHGGDPDRIIQQDIFDMLVADGLSEGMAGIVVSNIARMDMRGMWKKIKAHTEIKKEAQSISGTPGLFPVADQIGQLARELEATKQKMLALMKRVKAK